MPRRMVLLLALAACAPAPEVDDRPVEHTGPVETYGFLTRLGDDTVAAERISRSATALVSDAVDQWPIVRQRHTEFAIAPDGRLSRMVMEITTPSGTTEDDRFRRVLARFTPDSVHVTIHQASRTTARSFATEGALTVPHVSMLYGVIEFEIMAALQRAASVDSGQELLFRQFYPDRDVGPSFVLHRGRVVPQGPGRIELRHDWLAGTGVVTVDTAGRLLHYDGDRTTYKVQVERLADPPDVEAIAASLVARERAAGPRALSVRDTARGTIGPATLEVDYGRPIARGRVLLGNVISYDRVWRTGANAATQFTTSAPLTIGGLDLPAGSYTLWTVPHRDGAELILNAETGQWGTGYDATRDVGRVPLRVEDLATPVDTFTIAVVPRDGRSGALTFAWGPFRWTAEVVVR